MGEGNVTDCKRSMREGNVFRRSLSVQGGGCILDAPPLQHGCTSPSGCTPRMHPAEGSRGVSMLQHGGASRGQGVHPCCSRGSPRQNTDGQQAVSTHPTGMHSYLGYVLFDVP